MKKTIASMLAVVLALVIGFGSLNAGNKQEYSMDRALCAKYIGISRQLVDQGNLALAKAYAKKAVQANSWDKKAWANYNSIIQELAYAGEIPEYGAEIEESSTDGPSAGGAAPQLEGC